MKNNGIAIALMCCAVALALGLIGCGGSSGSSGSAVPPSASPSGANSSSGSGSGASGVPSSPGDMRQQGGVLPESAWGSLFAAMGDEYVAFGRRVQGELPVRAYAMYQGEGGGEPLWYDNEADITALFNALAAANATDEAGEVRTDDYTSFGFEFADGSSTSFMFDSMTFMVADGNAWKVYGLEYGADLEAFAARARAATLGS